jgi:hypothetical protein
LQLELQELVTPDDDRPPPGGGVRLVVGGVLQAGPEVRRAHLRVVLVEDGRIVAAHHGRDVGPTGGDHVPADVDVSRPVLEPQAPPVEGGSRDELPEVDVGAHDLRAPQRDLEVVENPPGRPDLCQKL